MNNNFNEVKKARSFSSILSLIIIGVLAIVLILLALWIFFYVKSGLSPADKGNTKTKEIEIAQGASSTQISEQLEKEGIINNATMFKLFLKFNNYNDYKSGQYDLSPSMTLDDIAKSMEEGEVYKPVLFQIAIPEGYTIEQIAKKVADKTKITEKDFINKTKDKAFIKSLQKEYKGMISDDVFGKSVKFPLEGYLFPATYDFTEEKPSAEIVIKKMIEATYNNSYAKYKSLNNQMTYTFEGDSKKMSFHDLLTLSSMVEREATSLADRAKIASVFYNRMEIAPTSMPLQTDPTVLYALGEHKSRTMYEDLEVDSPYNTYKNKGLTPGPIAAPGIQSIESVIEPATTDYLYFLADKEGKNHFATTLDEHNANKAKYITNE